MLRWLLRPVKPSFLISIDFLVRRMQHRIPMHNTELHSIVCCFTGMKERNETEKFLSPEGTGKGFLINEHLLCSFSLQRMGMSFLIQTCKYKVLQHKAYFLIQINADSLYPFACWSLCLLFLLILMLIILMPILIEIRSMLIVND